MTTNGSHSLKITGLIASKNPVPALLKTVESIFLGGATQIIVVDDGSDNPASKAVFDQVQAIGAHVIHLPENVGKAAALRVGFQAVPLNSLIVQTDDDTLASDLSIPREILVSGKADIVDIRVETNHTKSIIGLIQELDYWMMNAFVKRLQDLFRARLWMSGASVMYTFRAGQELLLQPSYTMTEDTEGLFRARMKGYNIRYCSKRESQFTTMVPEDWRGLRKQWKRWATGNGQVIGLYGLGGGISRVTLMNFFAWVTLAILPAPLFIIYGFTSTMKWTVLFSMLVGLIGPLSCAGRYWSWYGRIAPRHFDGMDPACARRIVLAMRKPLSLGHMGWVSPKRTAF